MTVFARSFLTGCFACSQSRKVLFFYFALQPEASVDERPLGCTVSSHPSRSVSRHPLRIGSIPTHRTCPCADPIPRMQAYSQNGAFMRIEIGNSGYSSPRTRLPIGLSCIALRREGMKDHFLKAVTKHEVQRASPATRDE